MADLPIAPVTAADGRRLYTVSQLNREVRSLLEASYADIWVEGEITNLSAPASGHLYFSLADDQARIRCVLFRSRVRALGCRPADGLRVLARGRVSLYENRGDYQLIVEYLEPAGEGALRLAFEQLKRRLAAEGLFDDARKKPLPARPARVGVLASATGAALRDVLTTLRRRNAMTPVVLYPIVSQGDEAPDSIVRMLSLAAAERRCDVLILVRGGGSLEDLQAFNDERVARAIARCPLPVVTGVGHETDFTIADFVADHRAATPTAAAAAVVPDQAEDGRRVAALNERLRSVIQAALDHRGQRLDWARRRLRHPLDRLREVERRLQASRSRMQVVLLAASASRRLALGRLDGALARLSPSHSLERNGVRLGHARLGLERAVGQCQRHERTQLATLEARLAALDPEAVVRRGYAIVRSGDGRRVLRRATDVSVGDPIRAELADGSLAAHVDAVLPKD